jgi:hypothetical protein
VLYFPPAGAASLLAAEGYDLAILQALARLDRLIPQALADAAAWTAEERQQLAEAMWAARTETTRFRVTADEKAQIEANAAQHGLDPSEFMRSRAVA